MRFEPQEFVPLAEAVDDYAAQFHTEQIVQPEGVLNRKRNHNPFPQKEDHILEKKEKYGIII